MGEGKCAIFGVDTKLESTYWFLFTDVLLIAKPSKGAFKFKIENLVILSTLPLLWEVKGKEANKLQQFAFSIVLPDRANVKITICLKSKDERQAMMDLLSSYIAEYMSEHERKALLCAGKGLAMKGETGNIVVEEKDKDRPIFFEELLVEGKDPLAEDMSRKERDNIQFESKLLKRVGIEKEDNVFEKLKKGQRGHDLDRKGMFTAVRNRDINAIKTFLDQSPDYCHIRDKRDASPLHVACQMGHLEAIQLLIDQGSDLGQKDKKGNTPFHWFCRAKYDSAKEAELLLEGFSEAIDEGFLFFFFFFFLIYFVSFISDLLFIPGLLTLIPLKKGVTLASTAVFKGKERDNSPTGSLKKGNATPTPKTRLVKPLSSLLSSSTALWLPRSS